MATKTKPSTNTVATANGPVSVDPDTMYVIKLASAVRHLGVWYRPSDKNIKWRGDFLLAAAEGIKEGTIVDAAPLS